MKILKYVVLIIGFMGLVACGGGTKSSDKPNDGTRSFKVDVGEDLRVELNQSITIIGLVIKDDAVSIVSYLWTKDSEILSKKASLNYTPTITGKKTLTLTVIDSNGKTASDSLDLTVYQKNQAPRVDVGKDVVIAIDENVTLVGKATDSDGSIISYAWTKDNIVVSTDVNFTYVPTEIGEEHLTLVVTDDSNLTSMDSIKIITTMRPFITRWSINDAMLKLNTQGKGFDYLVDWGDGEWNENVSGSTSHNYKKAGTYLVKISGKVPHIDFSRSEELLAVEQWGDIAWQSMKDTFFDCSALQILAEDTPHLSDVIDMSNMFSLTTIKSNLNSWDVSHVKNMSYMFAESDVNPSIEDWNVSSVEDMSSMFRMAVRFDRDISSWDVSNVKTIEYMFLEADSFNREIIKDWNISDELKESMF